MLEIKADLGDRTRKAYESKDLQALQEIIKDYDRVEERLEVFYKAYRKQWYIENKGFGWEVQDMRLGGLKRRVRHCKERLMAYVAGEVEKIEELEEKRLDFLGNGEDFQKKPILYGYWDKAYTANIM